MSTFASKGDASSLQLYCCATRASGGERKAQAPVPWLMGRRLERVPPLPRLCRARGKRQLKRGSRRRTRIMTEGNVAGNSRCRRQKKKNPWLEGTTFEALVPAAGTTA